MSKRRILILGLVFVAVAVVISLRQAHVSAQQMMNAKVTPGNVERVVLLKIALGHCPAFDRDIVTNIIPVYEEKKKAGILSGYQFFYNLTTDNPDDRGVGIVLTYPNFATLDNLAERTDPLTLKHYGSAAKRQEANEQRIQNATVVSSRLIRTIQYSQGIPVGN